MTYGTTQQVAHTAGIDPFIAVGFSERDFDADNRAHYEAKIAALVKRLR